MKKMKHLKIRTRLKFEIFNQEKLTHDLKYTFMEDIFELEISK